MPTYSYGGVEFNTDSLFQTTLPPDIAAALQGTTSIDEAWEAVRDLEFPKNVGDPTGMSNERYVERNNTALIDAVVLYAAQNGFGPTVTQTGERNDKFDIGTVPEGMDRQKYLSALTDNGYLPDTGYGFTTSVNKDGTVQAKIDTPDDSLVNQVVQKVVGTAINSGVGSAVNAVGGALTLGDLNSDGGGGGLPGVEVVPTGGDREGGKTNYPIFTQPGELGSPSEVLQQAIDAGASPDDLRAIMGRYPGSFTPEDYALVDELEQQRSAANPSLPGATDDEWTAEEGVALEDALDAILGTVNAAGNSPTGKVPTDSQGNPTTSTGGAPITPSTGATSGQKDVSGNPYDPEMERVYAERNPGYPNPYSLPEGEGQEGSGEGSGDGTSGTWWPGAEGGSGGEGGDGTGGGGIDWGNVNWGEFFDQVLGTGGVDPSGGGILGDILSRIENQDLMADISRSRQPKPYNMNVPGFGGVTFDGDNINLTQDPKITQLQDRAIDRANHSLADPNLNQIYEKATTAGNRDLIPAYEQARDTLPMDQYVDQFSGRAESIFNSAQNNEMLSMLDPERNALRQAGTDQYGYANELMGQTNYDELAQNRYDLLSKQAAPYEQMQRNNLEESLYTRGGSGSKVGAMDRGALGLTQSTADIQRQMEGQDLGQRMRETNLNAASNMFQGGNQSMGTSGQLFGIGAGADAQKASTLGNLNYNTLQGQVQGTQAENRRRRNVLADVQNMIGFGQGVRADQTAQAASDYDIANTIFNQQMDMTQTAAHPGGAPRTRGYNSPNGLSASEIYDLVMSTGVFGV
jgi:hypothetical protein